MELDLQDNDEIRVGTGDDEDLSRRQQTLVKDASGGNLIINATNLQVKLVMNTNVLYRNYGGAFTAYHNNVYKFATKSDGVNVVGMAECELVAGC